MSDQPKRSLGRNLILAMLMMLVLVGAWHVLLPALGIATAITAGVITIASISVVIICGIILLFFLLTGIPILIAMGIGLVWVIIALMLAPILFPILVPLLIIMIVIALIRRRGKD